MISSKRSRDKALRHWSGVFVFFVLVQLRPSSMIVVVGGVCWWCYVFGLAPPFFPGPGGLKPTCFGYMYRAVGNGCWSTYVACDTSYISRLILVFIFPGRHVKPGSFFSADARDVHTHKRSFFFLFLLSNSVVHMLCLPSFLLLL